MPELYRSHWPRLYSVQAVFGPPQPAGKSQGMLGASSGVLGPTRPWNRSATIILPFRPVNSFLFPIGQSILPSPPLTPKAWFDCISQKPGRENGRKPVVLERKPKISFHLLCCLGSYTVQEKEGKTENQVKSGSGNNCYVKLLDKYIRASNDSVDPCSLPNY